MSKAKAQVLNEAQMSNTEKVMIWKKALLCLVRQL